MLLIFSILFFCGCASEKKEDVIMKYINANFKNMNSNKESCVFIISERGCVNCNREMSKVATKFLDMQDIYVVVNANAGGTLVDISPYWEVKKKDQISYDTAGYFIGHDMQLSYAIFVVNNKVDTIIDSDARRILDNRDYITQRIIKNK